MDFPIIGGLTAEEQTLYNACVDVWRTNLNHNIRRRTHYSGHVDVASLDLGISVPPPMVRKLRNQPVMWTRKAVTHLADCSVFDGYTFLDDMAPDGFDDVMAHNSMVDLYDEAKLSELMHCCAFWTVTPGEDGEPAVIINAYDAEHAAGLWDFRRRRLLCGIAIVDVDPKHPDQPTAANMYTSDCVIECVLSKKGWTSTRHPHSVGRPLMEPMRVNPTIGHPFGHSVITPAIMEIENDACREVVKMIMHSELYTAPTRWVMGAPDDIFANGRWQAYLGSIMALPRDENGDAATTGSYPVGDMQPHILLMRQYANMFAAESSVPIHSLLYTEANPSSAEAIQASESDLVKRAESMNRRNGASLVNIGLIATSIITETPFYALDAQTLTMKAKWKPESHPSVSANADAWTKYASVAPGIANSRVFWEQQGLDEPTVDRIMSDLNKANSTATMNALFGTTDTNTGADDGKPTAS